MNPKEAIAQIKKLIGFEEQQPEVAAPAADVEADANTQEDAGVPVALAEEPLAEPTPEAPAAPDYSAQIATLLERISALESANTQFSEQLQKAEQKAHNFSEALNTAVTLMEQFAAEPSAEPAQAPKDVFRKPNTAGKESLVAAFQSLKPSKNND